MPHESERVCCNRDYATDRMRLAAINVRKLSLDVLGRPPDEVAAIRTVQECVWNMVGALGLDIKPSNIVAEVTDETSD